MIHFFYLLITLITALFFIMLGALTLLLPWSEQIRMLVIDFIQSNAWPWNLFGCGFLLIGLGLLAQIWLSSRRRYHVINVGLNETIVSDKVLDDYLHSYWAKLFPTQDVPYKFAIKKNKLKVTADLPFIPQDDQKELIEKISEDLSLILRDFLGFKKSMELSLSFENKRPKAK